MTDGQDYGQSGQYPQPGQHPQPGQYPQPGYGQQYGPPGQPRPQPGYGQQYPPEDQPWQPQHDPRQYRRRHGGPPEEPWQQAPYPPQDYPQQAPYPPRDYPQQAPYPPQDYPRQDYPPQDYPPRGQWQPQQPQQDYGQFQPPRQRHHRKRSRTPLYAGVAALIVIAGGGTAYALAGHGGTPKPATGGITQAAAKPASLSQLKKIVLQRADVPSSWKAAPYQPDPNDAANNAALMRCVGARDTDSDKVAEANSDNFNLGNASIASSATSYRSQSDLVSDVATLHSPKLSACFGQMMKKELAASLPKGATTESASIKITPGSAGGPANVVATGTGTIKIQLDGQQVLAYLSVAFITGPLIESEVDAENVGSPVPASVVKPLVAAVANRAAKG